MDTVLKFLKFIYLLNLIDSGMFLKNKGKIVDKFIDLGCFSID